MARSRMDLGWLELFDATARHENLTHAAAELGTTQPALSYRLRRLETVLGHRLFERRHRGLRLSEEGRILHDAVRQSLTLLEGATRRIAEQSAAPQVRLATDFAFASYWLMPRLPDFRRLRPDIDVHVVASQAKLTPMADADVAVLFGKAADFGPRTTLLFPERVVPVCSPAFLAQRGPFVTPEVLLEVPLLHLEGPPERWFTWETWFAAMGVAWRSGQPDLSFNTYTLLVQAAAAGQGLALGWAGLVESLLASGQLVEACPHAVTSPRGYWLLPQRTATSEAAAELTRWILAEVALERRV